jgi:C-terminal processing protease CtpA/Prc
MKTDSHSAMLNQIADLIGAHFVFPDLGEQIAAHLRDLAAANGPIISLSPVEFANVVTKEFEKLAHDSHLRLDYDPQQAQFNDDSKALQQHHFTRARRKNFGFIKAENLQGNIGYLALNEFAPRAVAESIAVGALAFVANTSALIFDIRGNGGGMPDMVQLLISYLVDTEPQPLSGIYSRATNLTETWQTLTEIPGQRMVNVPVYVLVDRQTHSAAEAFAYDLQALKRATIIGERTRGGAHLVEFYPLAETFVLMLPIARAINPITGGNWQGTGVIPDIEVPTEAALQVAHRRMLQALIDSESDADEKTFLQSELESLSKVQKE